MTVYVEYLILNNFIANYAVLRTTNNLTVKSGKLRLWASVILSVIAGTLTPLIPLSGIAVSAIKLAISIVIVVVLTGRIRLKRYLVTFLTFYGVSFGVGGAVSGLVNFLSFTGGALEEEKLTLLVLVGAIVFRYISGQALSYIRGREKRCEDRLYLATKNGYLSASSFVDTGNTVTYKGEGVAFVSKKLKDKILTISTGDFVKVVSVGGENLFEVRIVKASYDKKVTNDLPVVFWEGGEIDVILYGGTKIETNTTHQKDIV